MIVPGKAVQTPWAMIDWADTLTWLNDVSTESFRRMTLEWDIKDWILIWKYNDKLWKGMFELVQYADSVNTDKLEKTIDVLENKLYILWEIVEKFITPKEDIKVDEIDEEEQWEKIFDDI